MQFLTWAGLGCQEMEERRVVSVTDHTQRTTVLDSQCILYMPAIDWAPTVWQYNAGLFASVNYWLELPLCCSWPGKQS